MNSVEVPEGFVVVYKQSFKIPKSFICISWNSKRNTWWKFWIPRFNYSCFERVE